MNAKWVQCFSLIVMTLLVVSCAKNNNVAKENSPQESKSNEIVVDSSAVNLEEAVVEDCDTQLHQIIENSNFKNLPKEFYTRIDDNRNDTLVIKVYVRNNLSDDERYQQIVESAVSWFAIFPQRDGIYQSMNAFDPEEPDFKKLKIDKKAFDNLVKCIDQQ